MLSGLRLRGQGWPGDGCRQRTPAAAASTWDRPAYEGMPIRSRPLGPGRSSTTTYLAEVPVAWHQPAPMMSDPSDGDGLLALVRGGGLDTARLPVLELHDDPIEELRPAGR